MLTKTKMTRSICVAIAIMMMLSLFTACGDKKVDAPKVPPKPDEYQFTGRSVNWSGRVFESENHLSNKFLQNQSANMGHIKILGNPENIIIQFNLPSELIELRGLGYVPRSGPYSLSTIANNAPVMKGNSYTLNLNDAGIKNVNSGQIIFRAIANANDGNGTVGYYAITFERVQSLPSSGGAVTTGPTPPTKGIPKDGKSITSNKIPSQYWATYTASTPGVNHRVDLSSGGIDLFTALAGVNVTDLNMKDFSTLPTISAQHNNPLAWTKITAMQESPTQGLWFKVSALGFVGTDSNLHVMTFDVNVNSKYLVISNFTSTFPNLKDEAATVAYTKAGTSDAIQGNWVTITWVTVSAVATGASGGRVVGAGTYEQGEMVELCAASPPNADISFEAWVYKGNIISTDPTIEFPAAFDMRLEAVFTEDESTLVEPQRVNIAVTNGYGGTAYGGGTFNQGDWVTLWAEPYQGYSFVGFYDEQGRLITSEEYYSLIAEYNRTMEVRFTQNVPDVIEPRSVDPNSIAPKLNTASEWALAELTSAFAAELVPDSIAYAGWQNGTTRLAAADAIVLLLEKVLGTSMTQLAADRGWDLNRNQFSDTNSQAVIFLRYAGVITGVGNNRYSPYSIYNRAQMVTMLGRTAEVFLGLAVQGTNPFTDEIPSWAAPYVGFAADVGIISGVGKGRFGAYQDLQNQQTAVLAYRAFLAWRSYA